MASVIVYLVLSVFLVCCDCNPIKRSTNVQDDDCYGTECYYSDLDTTNEIVLPENLTEVILVNLPLISHNQAETLSILGKQIANQERIVTLLASQQASLDTNTETQIQIVRILEGITTQMANQAASLSTQTENQNQSVSLQSNQTITLDLIAAFLNNFTGSLNTMIAKHDHMDNLPLDKNYQTSFTTTPTPKEKTILSTPQNDKATPKQITMKSPLVQDETTPSINPQQESMTTMTADVLRDCTDVALHSSLSQPYRITPNDASRSYTMRCDLQTDGGGWTVIQRRFDGSVDFYRDWQDYVDGFGDPYGEYWAGLEFIHLLTQTGMWELRVDLEDFDGNTTYDQYASFRVGNAASMYRLSRGTHSGTAGDGMEFDNNEQFSTRDTDNDGSSLYHCAEKRKGGWWYSSCSVSNPNGKYLGPNQANEEGLTWWSWKITDEVLKKSEMKIRRI